jgi:hypothetical protein
MTRRPRRIEVRIDRLILQGVDPRDRKVISAALARDLGRRLARETPAAATRPRSAADRVTLAARGTASGRSIGAAVAKAVQRVLGP